MPEKGKYTCALLTKTEQDSYSKDLIPLEALIQTPNFVFSFFLQYFEGLVKGILQ